VQIRRSIAIALSLFMMLLVVGTLGYVLIEGWTPLDALWMVVITLTTIGYGEVQPLSPFGRIFTIGYILAGLGVGTYAMTRLTNALLEGDIAGMIRNQRRRRRLKALDGHYIVVGYGRLGHVVVRELRETGVPVCIIDRDTTLVSGAALDSGIVALQGDGADDAVLLEAGLERARGLAVTVAPVAEAIFVTLSARQLNPDVPILTRVESDESSVKARRAGATAVVSPHIMGGWRMAHGLAHPHATNFLDLATLAEHDDIMLDEITVHAACRWCGQMLRDVDVAREQGVLVVAIRRQDGRMDVTPQASTVVGEGDILIVVGKPLSVRTVADAFREGH
jgi:voltage-gated potassium channel